MVNAAEDRVTEIDADLYISLACAFLHVRAYCRMLTYVRVSKSRIRIGDYLTIESWDC